MALRAAVDGLGVEIPYSFPGDINDPTTNPTNPNWVRGVAHLAPPGQQGVANGIPYLDCATMQLYTNEGVFGLTEWFQKKGIGEKDQEYIRRKIKETYNKAAAGMKEGDSLYINVAPYWNPYCCLCETESKRLIVEGGLQLRVTNAYVPQIYTPPPIPMSVTATLSVNVKFYADITASVYARNPYGNSWNYPRQTWKLRDDYEELKRKGSSSYIFAVPGQRIGDGVELLCTYEQVQALVPQLGRLLHVDYSAPGAADLPGDILKSQPFFAAHPETHAIIDALYPPDPLGANQNYLPGIYTKSDGSSFLVFGRAMPTTPNGNTNGFVDRIALDEHTGDPVTGVEVSTPPASVDANDYEAPSWSTAGTHPIAAQSSAVLPILFTSRVYMSYADNGNNTNADPPSHILEIVIKTGNQGEGGFDTAYIRAQCQPFMWGGGATYDYIPLDGAPEVDVDYDYGDDGIRSMLFKIPLNAVLDTDSEGNYVEGQEVTLRYAVIPTNIFYMNPGALHAGFMDANIVTGSTSGAVEYAHPTTTLTQGSCDNSKA